MALSLIWLNHAANPARHTVMILEANRAVAEGGRPRTSFTPVWLVSSLVFCSCRSSISLPSCEEHHQVCQSLLFPSCCAKTSTQTLSQVNWLIVFGFDLINVCTCILPTNFDPFLRLSCVHRTCAQPCPLLDLCLDLCYLHICTAVSFTGSVMT